MTRRNPTTSRVIKSHDRPCSFTRIVSVFFLFSSVFKSAIVIPVVVDDPIKGIRDLVEKKLGKRP